MYKFLRYLLICYISILVIILSIMILSVLYFFRCTCFFPFTRHYLVELVFIGAANSFEIKDSTRTHITTVRHCGLVGSAPTWDRTGCEFNSWQCRIYIPCSLSLRLLGVSSAFSELDTKIVFKKNQHWNNTHTTEKKLIGTAAAVESFAELCYLKSSLYIHYSCELRRDDCFPSAFGQDD